MTAPITEKNYPIRTRWFFKQIPAALLVALILFLALTHAHSNKGSRSGDVAVIMIIYLLLVGPVFFQCIVNVFRRSHFHYALEENFLVLHQGIISKQNRNLPYGVIQRIFVNQGWFEKLFGLASLTLEDSSNGGSSLMNSKGYIRTRSRFPGNLMRREVIGFMGNRIHFPGLKKKDADVLKSILLQKMEEQAVHDQQSGL